MYNTQGLRTIQKKVRGKKIFKWPEDEDMTRESKENITKRHLQVVLSDLSTNSRQFFDVK